MKIRSKYVRSVETLTLGYYPAWNRSWDGMVLQAWQKDNMLLSRSFLFEGDRRTAPMLAQSAVQSPFNMNSLHKVVTNSLLWSYTAESYHQPMKHHRKSSTSGELAGDSQWHAMASAKILFGEFRSHAQIYGAFTLTLGLLFGLHDGPRTDVEPPEPNTERKTEMADVRKQIPTAPRQDKDQQKELRHGPWQDRDSQGSLEMRFSKMCYCLSFLGCRFQHSSLHFMVCLYPSMCVLALQKDLFGG